MTRTFSRAARARMIGRSFLVQGSWNYETLIGTGFAFCLLPALREAEGDEERVRAALARHATLFNSHPYFATVALGAVARLEADGTPEAVTLRFKNALRGSLGSLGDQLFWRAARPVMMLFGVLLALIGVAWWAVLGIVFTAYNAAHLATRIWGLRAGLEGGLEVGRILREAPLQPMAGRIADVGAVLAGCTVVFAVEWATPDLPQALLLAASAGLGAWAGGRTRWIGATLVGAVVAIALVL